MPYFPPGTGRVTVDDTDGSASNPAPQLASEPGTRAPQNTPAAGNTPRDSSPGQTIDVESSSPGQAIDAEPYADGHVLSWHGDDNMNEIDERLVIKLLNGTIVNLAGAKARKARLDARPLSRELPVQVVYVGATNEVQEVMRRIVS